MATAPNYDAAQSRYEQSQNTMIERHQDLLLQELRSEVSELRNRQGDFNQLKEQIAYLQDKSHQTSSEKNRSDQECSQKLFEGMGVVDSLVKELDELRQLNRIEEDHQVQLLQQMSSTCHEHDSKEQEKRQLTGEMQQSDLRNESERRDLEFVQKQIRDAQQVNLNQSDKMNDLRERGSAKDDSNEASKHQIRGLQSEIESTTKRIQHQEDLIVQRKEDIFSVENTTSSAHNEISSIKYELKQLDNEICYFEEQNRRHQQAQSQLQKANEYEVCRSKELQITEADAKVRLQSRDSELNSIEYDLDQTKEQNSRQLEASQQMQDEIDALNNHMNLITAQNYELSSELQRFLQTDEVVKTKLNRRSVVDEIKHKVDTAIMRSQQEVEARRSQSPARQSLSNVQRDSMERQQQHEHCMADFNGQKHESMHGAGSRKETRNDSRHEARMETNPQQYRHSHGSPLRSKSPPRVR